MSIEVQWAIVWTLGITSSVFTGIIGWLVYTSSKASRELCRAIDILEWRGHAASLRGLYLIRCSITGATYLGSTKVNFHSRWGQHLAQLRRGNHQNLRLQEAWNAHGPESITFHILETLNDDDEIVEREREYLRDRAMGMKPELNLNVSHSKVYPVPVTVELDPSVQAPRQRYQRRYSREVKPIDWDQIRADIEAGRRPLKPDPLKERSESN